MDKLNETFTIVKVWIPNKKTKTSTDCKLQVDNKDIPCSTLIYHSGSGDEESKWENLQCYECHQHHIISTPVQQCGLVAMVSAEEERRNDLALAKFENELVLLNSQRP